MNISEQTEAFPAAFRNKKNTGKKRIATAVVLRAANPEIPMIAGGNHTAMYCGLVRNDKQKNSLWNFHRLFYFAFVYKPLFMARFLAMLMGPSCMLLIQARLLPAP